MVVELKSASSSRRSPYMGEAERETFLSEHGYSLSDIPQFTARASLVRRNRNTIFPTISNTNNSQDNIDQRASGKKAQVASQSSQYGRRVIDQGTKIHPNPIRRVPEAGASRHRRASGNSRPPLVRYSADGQNRPWIVRLFRKLYPANESVWPRLWRTAGYVVSCWFVVFWAVWLVISLLNFVMYGPSHTTQQTYTVNNVGYSASAYVQNGTVVVTILEKDGQNWKPIYSATTPQLDSSYWGNDLSSVVPIITGVNAKGVISIQLLGNIDWHFHRPTESVTLTPQKGGTLALAIVSSK